MLAVTSGHRLEGTLAMAWLGRFGLTAGRLAVGCFCSGLCPPEAVTVTCVLSAEGGGSLNGAPLAPETALVFRPGALYEGWSAPGYAWISLFVPRIELARLRSGVDALGLERLRSAAVLLAPLAEAERDVVRKLIESLEVWHPRPTRERIAPAAADAACDRFSAVLGALLPRSAAYERPRAQRRGDRTLEVADRFFRRNLARPLYVADLVRETKTPERTLAALFRRRFGVPPMTYLKWLRLDSARRMLTYGGRGARVSVTDAALSVGFEHLGRFAAAYRRAFGESPSETQPADRTPT